MGLQRLLPGFLLNAPLACLAPLLANPPSVCTSPLLAGHPLVLCTADSGILNTTLSREYAIAAYVSCRS